MAFIRPLVPAAPRVVAAPRPPSTTSTRSTAASRGPSVHSSAYTSCLDHGLVIEKKSLDRFLPIYHTAVNLCMKTDDDKFCFVLLFRRCRHRVATTAPTLGRPDERPSRPTTAPAGDRPPTSNGGGRGGRNEEADRDPPRHEEDEDLHDDELDDELDDDLDDDIEYMESGSTTTTTTTTVADGGNDDTATREIFRLFAVRLYRNEEATRVADMLNYARNRVFASFFADSAATATTTTATTTTAAAAASPAADDAAATSSFNAGSTFLESVCEMWSRQHRSRRFAAASVAAGGARSDRTSVFDYDHLLDDGDDGGDDDRALRRRRGMVGDTTPDSSSPVAAAAATARRKTTTTPSPHRRLRLPHVFCHVIYDEQDRHQPTAADHDADDTTFDPFAIGDSSFPACEYLARSRDRLNETIFAMSLADNNDLDEEGDVGGGSDEARRRCRQRRGCGGGSRLDDHREQQQLDYYTMRALMRESSTAPSRFASRDDHLLRSTSRGDPLLGTAALTADDALLLGRSARTNLATMPWDGSSASSMPAGYEYLSNSDDFWLSKLHESTATRGAVQRSSPRRQLRHHHEPCDPTRCAPTTTPSDGHDVSSVSRRRDDLGDDVVLPPSPYGGSICPADEYDDDESSIVQYLSYETLYAPPSYLVAAQNNTDRPIAACSDERHPTTTRVTTAASGSCVHYELFLDMLNDPTSPLHAESVPVSSVWTTVLRLTDVKLFAAFGQDPRAAAAASAAGTAAFAAEELRARRTVLLSHLLEMFVARSKLNDVQRYAVMKNDPIVYKRELAYTYNFASFYDWCNGNGGAAGGNSGGSAGCTHCLSSARRNACHLLRPPAPSEWLENEVVNCATDRFFPLAKLRLVPFVRAPRPPRNREVVGPMIVPEPRVSFDRIALTVATATARRPLVEALLCPLPPARGRVDDQNNGGGGGGNPTRLQAHYHRAWLADLLRRIQRAGGDDASSSSCVVSGQLAAAPTAVSSGRGGAGNAKRKRDDAWVSPAALAALFKRLRPATSSATSPPPGESAPSSDERHSPHEQLRRQLACLLGFDPLRGKQHRRCRRGSRDDEEDDGPLFHVDEYGGADQLCWTIRTDDTDFEAYRRRRRRRHHRHRFLRRRQGGAVDDAAAGAPCLRPGWNAADGGDGCDHGDDMHIDDPADDIDERSATAADDEEGGDRSGSSEDSSDEADWDANGERQRDWIEIIRFQRMPNNVRVVDPWRPAVTTDTRTDTRTTAALSAKPPGRRHQHEPPPTTTRAGCDAATTSGATSPPPTFRATVATVDDRSTTESSVQQHPLARFLAIQRQLLMTSSAATLTAARTDVSSLPDSSGEGGGDVAVAASDRHQHHDDGAGRDGEVRAQYASRPTYRWPSIGRVLRRFVETTGAPARASTEQLLFLYLFLKRTEPSFSILLNGNPGSGKSTVMRFIIDTMNHQTINLLPTKILRERLINSLYPGSVDAAAAAAATVRPPFEQPTSSPPAVCAAQTTPPPPVVCLDMHAEATATALATTTEDNEEEQQQRDSPSAAVADDHAVGAVAPLFRHPPYPGSALTLTFSAFIKRVLLYSASPENYSRIINRYTTQQLLRLHQTARPAYLSSELVHQLEEPTSRLLYHSVMLMDEYNLCNYAEHLVVGRACELLCIARVCFGDFSQSSPIRSTNDNAEMIALNASLVVQFLDNKRVVGQPRGSVAAAASSSSPPSSAALLRLLNDPVWNWRGGSCESYTDEHVRKLVRRCLGSRVIDERTVVLERCAAWFDGMVALNAWYEERPCRRLCADRATLREILRRVPPLHVPCVIARSNRACDRVNRLADALLLRYVRWRCRRAAAAGLSPSTICFAYERIAMATDRSWEHNVDQIKHVREFEAAKEPPYQGGGRPTTVAAAADPGHRQGARTDQPQASPLCGGGGDRWLIRDDPDCATCTLIIGATYRYVGPSTGLARDTLVRLLAFLPRTAAASAGGTAGAAAASSSFSAGGANNHHRRRGRTTVPTATMAVPYVCRHSDCVSCRPLGPVGGGGGGSGQRQQLQARLSFATTTTTTTATTINRPAAADRPLPPVAIPTASLAYRCAARPTLGCSAPPRPPPSPPDVDGADQGGRIGATAAAVAPAVRLAMPRLLVQRLGTRDEALAAVADPADALAMEQLDRVCDRDIFVLDRCKFTLTRCSSVWTRNMYTYDYSREGMMLYGYPLVPNTAVTSWRVQGETIAHSPVYVDLKHMNKRQALVSLSRVRRVDQIRAVANLDQYGESVAR